MSKCFAQNYFKQQFTEIANKLEGLNPIVLKYCITYDHDIIIDYEGNVVSPSEEEIRNFLWVQKNRRVHEEYLRREEKFKERLLKKQ